VPLEILIATGSNPSRQRNLAASKARGDWLVFLDSDCRLEKVYFERLSHHVKRELEIVGGPVLLVPTATGLERTFQSLLAHPLLTGRSSSRYGPRGILRKCDDAELILCNLAVKRALFLQFSGFDERLYPNEENEWLMRLRREGLECWYDPKLIVRRPQSSSWRAFAAMLIRYGRGRTRQFVVSGTWDYVRQLPAFILLLSSILSTFRPRSMAKVCLATWLGLAALCKILVVRLGVPPLPISAALLGPVVPLLYGAGQVLELIDPALGKAARQIRVYRWEPDSEMLVPIA
jgi:glycosyltransferase involved in cell wall biosynthesis